MEKKKIEGLGITYKTNGFYMYSGKRNFFTGELSIDNQGKIHGKIKDPNSRRAEHSVEGKVNFVKMKVSNIEIEKIVLNFVKIPMGLLANIYYTLVKIEKPFNNLIGHYDGLWNFEEEVIPIIAGTEGETENGARLTLERI